MVKKKVVNKTLELVPTNIKHLWHGTKLFDYNNNKFGLVDKKGTTWGGHAYIRIKWLRTHSWENYVIEETEKIMICEDPDKTFLKVVLK